MQYGVLCKKKVYLRRKFTTVEQLKLAIIEEWRNLGQRFIDSSINELRRRLKKLVENQGGHIEHDFRLAKYLANKKYMKQYN